MPASIGPPGGAGYEALHTRPMATDTGARTRDGSALRRVLPCMTVKRTLPYSLPIDCAACTITTLGDRHRLEVVEIDGGLYAFHPTCLRPSRVKRADARPLTEQELAQLGDVRGSTG